MAEYTRTCIHKRIKTYDICVSSFFPRALQTAMILFHNYNKPIYVMPCVHEIRTKKAV